MGFTRADVRIDTMIDGSITASYDENGMQLPASMQIACIVTNISATGLSLECEREFSDLSAFHLNMTLQGQYVNIVVQIMRKEHLDNGKWSYGCKFMHLDEKEEQALRKYIFDTQLMLRRKQKFAEENKK